MRLDRYLSEKYTEFSRAQLQKFIDGGLVLVNKEVVTKNGFNLKEKDKVKLNKPKEQAIGKINLPVIYEDEDCVVINKPAGVLTHSKGAFNPEPTVASWLAERVKNFNGDREGIVHRLDRGTSGIMICAKNEEALKFLQKQFSTRKVKKTYTAIVENGLEPQEAVIDLPIERNPKSPQRFRVGSNGKSALTQYRVIKTVEKGGKTYDLLELAPTTGRTHQLRVHMQYLKYPILGDDFYGGPSSDRLYLHASRLEITLPNKERKVFESDAPFA